MSLINIIERRAISAKPYIERVTRIQRGVGKTLSETSTPEANREMKVRTVRPLR